MDTGKPTCEAQSFGISVDSHNEILRAGRLFSDFFFFGPANELAKLYLT